MKFDQILVCCMTHISNMFSAQWWKLETSSRAFYDLLKQQYNEMRPFFIADITIFNCPLLTFSKKLNTGILT